MTVALVVPYSDTDPARSRAWAWVAERYAIFHPDWPIIVGSAPSDTWRKGEAVADALARTDAEIIVVADADSFCPQAALIAAVDAVRDGAPWVMPHRLVWRIGTHFTGLLTRRAPVDEPGPQYLPRRGQRSVPVGGGIVVALRSGLLDVPLDRRFEGWGGEDIAWGWALDTLLGPHVSLDAPLYHLHHADAPTRRKALWATEVLAGRYGLANGDPVEMRMLVEEGR